MKVFADSSFFIALYDTSDENHQRAKQMLTGLQALSPQVITSDYVVDETLTYLLLTHPKYGFQRALRFDQDVVERGFCKLVFCEPIFAAARQIFVRFNRDKQWSFTDCTSFVLMKDLLINQVLTFDKHFAQMGFRLMS